MGVWRNIGKIVILLFQIVHEQIKWYIHSWTRDTTKKSNNETVGKLEDRDREINNIQLSEQEESVERSKMMLSQYDYEQVEWSENPFIKEVK